MREKGTKEICFPFHQLNLREEKYIYTQFLNHRDQHQQLANIGIGSLWVSSLEESSPDMALVPQEFTLHSQYTDGETKHKQGSEVASTAHSN